MGKPQLAAYLSFQWGAQQGGGSQNPSRFIRCLTQLQQLAGISASFPFGSGCTLRPRLAIKSRELATAPGVRGASIRSALIFQSSPSTAGEGFSSQPSSWPRGYLLGKARTAPCCHETADCSPVLRREGAGGLETPLHLPCCSVITIPQALEWCKG